MVDRAEADYTAPKPIKGEKQYRDFLLQSLGVTSLLIMLLVCWVTSLPTFLAEELALTEEEVIGFAGPGARLMAKSNIPDRVKTGLVNSGDYIGLTTVAVAYVYRVLSVMKQFEKGTVDEHLRQNQGISAPGGNGNGATGNGHTATASQLAGWGNFTAG